MSAQSLSANDDERMCWPMRTLLFLLATSLLAGPAAAQPHKPAATAPARTAPAPKPEGPKQIGQFDDWIAATNVEAGQTICYALTYANHSTPALPGRDKVVLTVTERPSGRDTVAISAGFTYAANAAVTVQADQAALDFYTASRSAFARDGKAAVTAFGRAKQVSARSPGPKNATVVDTFSLRGFSAAYAAITKACPAK